VGRQKTVGARPKDPMVPIYSPNLRAAIRDQDTTIAELARRLKTNPQTIRYLAAGDTVKRSRASRRSEIAKILKVDEPFLSTSGSIPSLLMGGALVTAGMGMFVSPRTQLALGRFLEKCFRAVERDLRTKTLKDRGIAETATADDVKAGVARCLRKLTDVDDQRGDVLVGAEQPFVGILTVGNGGILRGRHIPYDQDEEDAGVGLVAAWEQILEPWMAGITKLNYRRLSERAGFPVPAGERRSDTNPFIIVSPKGA